MRAVMDDGVSEFDYVKKGAFELMYSFPNQSVITIHKPQYKENFL